MIFGGDGTPGDGDVDAVKVGDRTQDKKSKYEEPAHAAFHTVSHANFLDSNGRWTWTRSGKSLLLRITNNGADSLTLRATSRPSPIPERLSSLPPAAT